MAFRCCTAFRSCADAFVRLSGLLGGVSMVFDGCSPLLLFACWLGCRLETVCGCRICWGNCRCCGCCCCCCCCPIAVRYSLAEQSPNSLSAMGEGAASPFWRARVRSMLLRTVTAMKFALKFSYRTALNSPFPYFCLHFEYSSRMIWSLGDALSKGLERSTTLEGFPLPTVARDDDDDDGWIASCCRTEIRFGVKASEDSDCNAATVAAAEINARFSGFIVGKARAGVCGREQ
mmetsp:Transcript_18111/g.41430  ORF Transcript_18111/g.41430 Transcript_18111/m.41430 type:complete len:233 (+) Transcript_18111:695-1393(+)